jgi:hypothetical protein
MIDLAQRSTPYEIALPYGLTVTVKPLTTASMAAAQATARRAVDAIERQARERTDAGLALDGLPDLSAEGERDGFYQAQLIRELATRDVTSWTGVELEGGPAPPTPENIAAVMEFYPVGERFFQEFTLRQVLLNATKTDSGPLPLALPAERRARILPRLPRRRPPLAQGEAGADGRLCPYREHALISHQEHEAWDVLLACQGQIRLAPSGYVIGIDVNVALQIGAARGRNPEVLSELLPAAEAGLVEALCPTPVADHRIYSDDDNGLS